MTFTLKEKEEGEGGGEEGRQWRGRKRGEKGKEEEKKLGNKGGTRQKAVALGDSTVCLPSNSSRC